MEFAKTASCGTPRARMCAPSSAPTSSPRSIRHSPPSATATAHRSASGSLASTRSGRTARGDLERGVDGAGLLGVGEGDRGEVRVGVLLARHRRRGGEAGPGEDVQQGGAAHAVQRGVHDRRGRGGCRGRRAGRWRPQVGLDDVVAQGLPAVVGASRTSATVRTRAMCAAMSASAGGTIWLPSPR